MGIEQLFPDRDEEEYDPLAEERGVAEYFHTLYVEKTRRWEEFCAMLLPENRRN